ncbi:sugar ABC transporter ATP-binding protein [Neorhizobium sp. P12A]|nr:sugar ABC transporter ATP-binding protein [Neorhizobium sp. P12A]
MSVVMSATTVETASKLSIVGSPAKGKEQPVIRADGLVKRYGPVTVLTDVVMDILPGEIHAIIGENGAGKSTLMRLLAGYVEPTGGRLLIDGQPVHFSRPHQAEAAGIVLVHQEILLAEALTVAENLFLGREVTRGGFIDDRTMKRRTRELLEDIGCDASPSALVRDLALADRQMVQIGRALLEEHRVVIFDEPTAVLTGPEVERLITIIERLKARGIAILYISHRLEEVERLADRVTVLRDGKLIGTYCGKTLSQMDMARLMVGRELATLYPPKGGDTNGDVIFEVRDAVVPGYARNVSFVARKGEVLGFAGMIGSGRTELFEGLVGLRPATAKVMLKGAPVHLRSQREAIDAGIGYLTEDRKGKGLLLQERLAPNLTLSALNRLNPGLHIRRRREDALLDEEVEHYDIRVKSRRVKAGQLSGGNQQKLLLAKVLLSDPAIVIIDEPTRGIDIANKAQIYAFIQKLVSEGKSCIVISSEMQELIGICDRILVMREAQINGELSGKDMTESNIALLATTDRGGMGGLS